MGHLRFPAQTFLRVSPYTSMVVSRHTRPTPKTGSSSGSRHFFRAQLSAFHCTMHCKHFSLHSHCRNDLLCHSLGGVPQQCIRTFTAITNCHTSGSVRLHLMERLRGLVCDCSWLASFACETQVLCLVHWAWRLKGLFMHKMEDVLQQNPKYAP